MRGAVFADRADAGKQLAERFERGGLVRPLVLAIPRGGIEVAAPIARELGAELDVVLARKLRAPEQPELAIGAISEHGEVHLNAYGRDMEEGSPALLERERQHQLAEIARRRALFRAVRPAAMIAGRDVIVVDDGVATGSTLIAALCSVRAGSPSALIAALPVMPVEHHEQIRGLCDRLECLIETDMFWAVGQFYRDFSTVSDDRVVELLREFAPRGGE